MQQADRQIESLIAGTPWSGWLPAAIAGDASTRRYFRLIHGDDSVILMDAPPAVCTDTARFISIAQDLRKAGLEAPEIYHANLQAGVLVMSDLGLQHVAAHLAEHPEGEMEIYQTATDVLLQVAEMPIPPGVARLTPEVGAEMLDVLGTHYCNHDVGALQDAVQDALKTHAPEPDTLSLRDFHAENLIWRPDHAGRDRIGLLDFQDAFAAPAGYDLASLLRDARRDVSPETVRATIAHFAQSCGKDIASFELQVAVLGVQRNLRILGVFARLIKDHGKPRYLAFVDRVWRNIWADLDHAALGSLRQAVDELVPPPEPALLQRVNA